MSVLTNVQRIGSFTSSEIWKLTKLAKNGKDFGVPALTYIEEKNMERRLGRSLTTEVDARATTWGKTLERFAFEQLGFDYDLCSQDSIVHPTIPFWTGTPDVRKPNSVGDIKCPLTLKSFCGLVDQIIANQPELTIECIRENHSDGEKYFWQLVSNAILTDSEYAELIVFCPYQSQLPEIKLMADDVYWIANAEDHDLPYLIDGGYYSNINVIRLHVTQADKDRLTECVLRAGEYLTQG